MAGTSLADGVPAASPAMKFPPELLLRAQGIKLAIFDVDGVLTDGGLYYSEAGESIKRFHVLDGLGIKLLRQVGIEPAVITGRDSGALRTRLAALGIERVQYGIDEKLVVAEQMLSESGLEWSAVAAMGDDWPDTPVMSRAALACAPANAHAEVKAIAHHITTVRGGHGAVRELCDLLVMASGHYARLLETGGNA